MLKHNIHWGEKKKQRKYSAGPKIKRKRPKKYLSSTDSNDIEDYLYKLKYNGSMRIIKNKTVKKNYTKLIDFICLSHER